jgi:hypothetical protein
MMKYFQEFTLTPALVTQIKQLNLIDTIARNMAEEGKYSLTPSCMELLNRMENSFNSAKDQQKIDAEDSLEELASRELKLTELDGLEFSLTQGVYQGVVITQGMRRVVPSTRMDEARIEELVLNEAPELFWMISLDSPLMNQDARLLVLQIQYFNQIIKLAHN